MVDSTNSPPLSVAGVELRFGLMTNVVVFGDSVSATGWDGMGFEFVS